MSPTTAGLVGMAALLVLLFLRMPIGIAMALVGAIGIAVLNSPDAALHILGSYPYSHGAVQALSVIPLFVLMGNFAVMSGMAYSATNTVIPKADTLVLLMGLQRLEEIVPAFLAQGWREATPVAAIQDATLPDQRICRSTLAGIAEATARRGFESPTLLVRGEVAALGGGENRRGAPH